MAGKGLQKVYEFSEELYQLTGKGKGKRTDAVKWVWAYIKKHGYNDPNEFSFLKNGQEIAVKGDELMEGVFGNKKKIRMFDVGKALNNHLFED